MPRDTFKIRPVGICDRRGLVTTIQDINVTNRINMMVIGQDPKERYIKKCQGTRRFNATAVGTSPVTSMYRYLKPGVTRNFFFSGGGIYYIDDNGNTTSLLSVFDTTVYPVFLEMRVSGTDILYFMEGVNTGMYSYDGNLSNQFNKEVAVTLNFVDAIEFLDRMWGFEENSEDLYFSKNLEPTNFTDSTDAGQITVAARRGSKLMKLALMNETLYIAKNDSIYVLEGRTPSEFVLKEVVSDKGLGSRHSWKNVESVLVGLMSDYEVWSFGGSRESMECLSYNIALSGDRTEEVLALINKNRLDQYVAEYDNFIYRLAFTLNGEITNDYEWCYNTVNKTDFLTKGNHVASYLKFDDTLLTGRADTGVIMYQYDLNCNYDNGQTGATMEFSTKTKFIGLDKAQNFRVKRVWMNVGVMTGTTIPVRTYIDARSAVSDSTSEAMDIYGEYKSPITLIKIASQDAITSRQTPRHNNSKGQNVAFEINDSTPDRKFAFSSFEMEIIAKNIKRGKPVGV